MPGGSLAQASRRVIALTHSAGASGPPGSAWRRRRRVGDAVDLGEVFAFSAIPAAPTFSSRCFRDFAPGIGTMNVPDRAPWAIARQWRAARASRFLARQSFERGAQLHIGATFSFESAAAACEHHRRSSARAAVQPSSACRARPPRRPSAPWRGPGRRRAGPAFGVARESEYSICSEASGWTALPRRSDSARTFRERDETCLALLDELGHAADALLDRHVGDRRATCRRRQASRCRDFSGSLRRSCADSADRRRRARPGIAVARAAAFRMDDDSCRRPRIASPIRR